MWDAILWYLRPLLLALVLIVCTVSFQTQAGMVTYRRLATAVLPPFQTLPFSASLQEPPELQACGRVLHWQSQPSGLATQATEQQ